MPYFSRTKKKRLKAAEFMAGNSVQLNQLKDMGIKIVTMADGRVQLYHTASDVSAKELYIRFECRLAALYWRNVKACVFC